MKKMPDKYIGSEESAIYSPVLSFSGEMVITSGQCFDDVEGFEEGEIPDIRTQTRNCIRACEEKLVAAGSSLDKVVFVEVNLSDMSEWSAFNEVYKTMMPDPKPARKAVEVGLLPGYKVELVMLAVK